MSTPPPFPSRRAAREAAQAESAQPNSAVPGSAVPGAAVPGEPESREPGVGDALRGDAPLGDAGAPQTGPGLGYPVPPETSRSSWPIESPSPEPPLPTRRAVSAPQASSPTETLGNTLPPVQAPLEELPPVQPLPERRAHTGSHAIPRTPPRDISDTAHFDSAELAGAQVPRPAKPEPVPPERVAILPAPPAPAPTPTVPERRSIKPVVGGAALDDDGTGPVVDEPILDAPVADASVTDAPVGAWAPIDRSEAQPAFDELLGSDDEYGEDEGADTSAEALAAGPGQWSDEDLFPTPTTRPSARRAPVDTPKRRRTAGDVVRGIIGVFGELLVTIGVILLLFVAWELWWTDYTGNKDQAQAVEQLNQSPGWVQAPTSPPAAGVKCTVNGSNDATCGGETPPQDVTNPGKDPYAVLQVPRWGSTWDQSSTYAKPISEGTDPAVLNTSGIGHYDGSDGFPATQMVADVGNFGLAAHRRTHGAPFRYIQELKDGDSLIVQTANYYYVYTVKATDIVDPNGGGWVVGPDPTDPATGKPVLDGTDKRLITLTTCHPEFSTKERYIVWGELSYWTPKTNADGAKTVPQELLPAEGQ